MEFVWKCLMTFGIAMVPVVELRGAIPMAYLNFQLPFWLAFLLSFVGNLLPVPFIILFIRKIFAWLSTKGNFLGKVVNKLENKAHSKEAQIRKYGPLALLLFVAIPIPGTGAWTGALVAALLDIRLKTAFPIITLGVLIAGIITSVITFGANAVFSFL